MAAVMTHQPAVTVLAQRAARTNWAALPVSPQPVSPQPVVPPLGVPQQPANWVPTAQVAEQRAPKLAGPVSFAMLAVRAAAAWVLVEYQQACPELLSTP